MASENVVQLKPVRKPTHKVAKAKPMTVRMLRREPWDSNDGHGRSGAGTSMSKAIHITRARMRRNTRLRAARPSTSPSIRARRSQSCVTDAIGRHDRWQKAIGRCPRVTNLSGPSRSVPSSAMRTIAFASTLDAAATRDRAAHPDRPALVQHHVGLADWRRGVGLPDRPGAKPARASRPPWADTHGQQVSQACCAVIAGGAGQRQSNFSCCRLHRSSAAAFWR
jgi:hypothetical protein